MKPEPLNCPCGGLSLKEMLAEVEAFRQSGSQGSWLLEMGEVHLPEMAARLRTVAVQHRPKRRWIMSDEGVRYEGKRGCTACGGCEWPCSTQRALDGER